MKHILLTIPLLMFARSAVAGERPNVVVFFVDDLGWTDLSCFGSDLYETPNIDRLAAAGVKFTQAYAACTVCSPSRAALLTGQYPARLQLTDFIPGHQLQNTPLVVPDWTQRLELREVTIAELLQGAGYRTAHLGKWHLTPRDRNSDPNSDGDYPQFYPDRQGFEFNVGGCERGAPASYFWPYGRGQTIDERSRNNTFRTLPESDAGEGTYLTDQLAEEAVRIIAESGRDPFFLYFSFYNVHTPLQGRPDLVEKYARRRSANPHTRHHNPVYAAMIESVDSAVGRVMNQLRQQGLINRTMIIFSSDNGGLAPRVTSNLPLRQGKGSIYEGGVRVPAMICLPGVAVPGTVSEEPVITVDFFPTILDVVGIELSEHLRAVTDGQSLVPLLTDPGHARSDRDALFWHYPHYHMMGAVPYSAVRAGQWKLIERHDGAPLELYNLSEDIHEDQNLAESHPARTRELQNRLTAWRESVGAQMPVRNPNFDPALPTGRSRGGNWSSAAAVRE